MPRKRLGQLLMEAGLVDEAQIRTALATGRSRGMSLGRALVELGLVKEPRLVAVLSRYHRVAPVHLDELVPSTQSLALLDEAFCRRHECLPLSYQTRGRVLDLAMVDPTPELFERLRAKVRCTPRPHLAGPLAIAAAIDRAYNSTDDEIQWTPTRRPASEPAPVVTPTEAVAQRSLGKPIPSTADSSLDIDVWLEDSRAGLLKLTSSGLPAVEPVGDDTRPTTMQRAVSVTAQPAPIQQPDQETDPSLIQAGLERLTAEVADLRRSVAELARSNRSGTRVMHELLVHLSEQGILSAAALEESRLVLEALKPDNDTIFNLFDTSGGDSRTNARDGAPLPVAMDFGTTRSSVAVMIDGKPTPLPLPGGERDMPSVVGFRGDGSVMLGAAARNMLGTDPANAISSPKRLLGRAYSDRELEPYIAAMAMATSEGAEGEVVVHSRGQQLTLPEVCSHIMLLLRLVAQRQLAREVNDVVLTTPVSFTKAQYKALGKAAALAGLRIVGCIDEPTAAALANRSDSDLRGCVAVYDFGGGTFDFSLVEVSGNTLKVITTAGDPWLGGDDFDEALANAAANDFWRQHNIELRHQVVQWQRLLVACERAKRELSVKTTSAVKLPGAALTSHGPLDLHFPVSRGEFAGLCSNIIDRSLDTVRCAMEENDVKLGDVNAVYLSSGTTYIPAVREGLTEFFGKPPKSAVPAERAVLFGAAIYAAQLAKSLSGDGAPLPAARRA